MIRLTLDTAVVAKAHKRVGWIVMMPEDGTIIAYCDTEKEADTLVRFFLTLCQMARGVN